MSDEGYWLASADGGVYAVGDAGFYGSLGALHLQGPIVAMAATPDGRGYWLAALDGGVFAFGDAGFYGSMGGVPLNQPIVGMAATPDGRGYWLVASDGGVFAFGDAPFLGSMGGTPLVVAGDRHGRHPLDGDGYWLVGGDGGIFSFGDARFHGSIGGTPLNDPIVGMTPTPDDGGYYFVATDGGVFTEGDAVFRGSLGGGLDGNPHVILPVAAITLDHGRLGLLAPRSRRLQLLLHQPAGPVTVGHGVGHRLGGGRPGERRPGHGLLLQSLRPLRGVVRAVRHLGVGAGRGADPVVRVHRRHLRLGGGRHRGAAADGHAAAGRRRPLRDGSVVDGVIGPRRAGGPGLAGRGRRHRRGRRRARRPPAAWPSSSTAPTCRSHSLQYNGVPVYAFAQP